MIAQGKEQGITEGKEKAFSAAFQKTVLNAFDNGFDMAAIRLITSEREEKINPILIQNNRIR